MKTINDISLRDTIPDSIAKDDKISSAIAAIDPQLHAIAKRTETPSIYYNIDNLTSDQLDNLAWQFDLSTWREKWDVAIKRNVLKTAIKIKSKNGTLSAVKEAIASLGSAAIIKEWWQEQETDGKGNIVKGTPHTFKVLVSLGEVKGQLQTEVQEDVMSLIDYAKPLRSHYTFSLVSSFKGGVSASGCIRALAFSQIRSRTDVSADKISAYIGTLATARPMVSRHLIAKGE